LNQFWGLDADPTAQGRIKGAKPVAVLDIGSNDGTQLKHYQKLGYSVLGVESSRSTAAIANACGIETVRTFFNSEVARALNRKFDVINASGVFFHLEELHSVTDGIRECLKRDGVFVVQFLYMKQIVENLAFDQIYHEHLLYYNLATIQTLLKRHGLEMFDCYLSPIHGGSIIGFVTHAGQQAVSPRFEMMLAAESDDGSNELETYRRFALDIRRKKAQSLEFLTGQRDQGKQIFGLGAPAKGNTLLNYFGIGPKLIGRIPRMMRIAEVRPHEKRFVRGPAVEKSCDLCGHLGIGALVQKVHALRERLHAEPIDQCRDGPGVRSG